MTGQRIVAGVQALSDDGAERRQLYARNLVPAVLHMVVAFAVIAIARVDAANERQLIHMLRRHRQQFGNVRSGNRSRNRPERSTGVCLRLRIPTFQLAQSARHVDDNDPFLVFGQLGGCGWLSKNPESTDNACCGGSQELTTSELVLIRPTGISAFQRLSHDTSLAKRLGLAASVRDRLCHVRTANTRHSLFLFRVVV